MPMIFLSTPSARRATTLYHKSSLTMRDFYPRPPRGGRPQGAGGTASAGNFYPRPPRGGRRFSRQPSFRQRRISIHALREEGDNGFRKVLYWSKEFLSTPSARRATAGMIYPPYSAGFLSTPSARRATAKTETKSLFSYKLYNILHEFRRALIYNGSKNYPNHAK